MTSRGWLWGVMVTLSTCLIISLLQTQVAAIGCYVCSSINGSEPLCEDTFNSTMSFYSQQCKAGRKGRSGLFPGTHCVKMKAERAFDGQTVIVRRCVVDNGDINAETEIGRSNHCGLVTWMEFDGHLVKGCVLSCNTDGCNAADRHGVSLLIIVTALLAIVMSS